MAKKPAFILTSNGPISIYFGTVTKTVNRNDPIFAKVIDLLKPSNPATIEDILSFIDPTKRLKKHACGHFDVCNGGVYINGERTPDMFSKRALEIADLGLDVVPLVNLWNNIKKNPDQDMVKDLYVFLDRNEHPITQDGCFIGYKSISKDFKDLHSSTYDNKPGSVVKMDRNGVVVDRNITCAAGLHVASLTYARDSYGGSVIVVCKVNPKNCVSVPVDHSQQKLRCCEYEVLEVLEDVSKPLTTPIYNHSVDNQKEAQKEAQKETPIYSASSKDIAVSLGATVRKTTNDNHKYQQRDSRGHFIKNKKV